MTKISKALRAIGRHTLPQRFRVNKATAAEAPVDYVDERMSPDPFAERWLLISNCQTYGLARALQMVNPDVHVTPLDYWNAVRDPASTRREALERGYSRIVISPEIEEAGINLEGAPNLTRIPRVVFTAFHPDCVYALSAGKQVKGPLDAYHSMILIAAHRRGLGADGALRLFSGAFFEKVGYMDYWAPQRDRLVADYARFGLDIAAGVRRWGRTSAFMHTVDHPKMICIYDIARSLFASMGVPDEGAGVMPADNLTNGVSFAVYPEIGEALGVQGSYRFKRFNEYHHIGLEQFIAESFRIYDQHPDIRPDSGSMPAFERVLEAIG